MKRSTQVGLAAAGFIAVASVGHYILSSDEPPVPSEAVNACAVGGTRTVKECEADVRAAMAEYKQHMAAPAVGEPIQSEPASAPASPAVAANNSGNSGSRGMSFLEWYAIHKMMQPDTGYARSPSYDAPSSAFSRAGNPSQYRDSPVVTRPAPSVRPPAPSAPNVSAPSVVSRGGFGGTSLSMGGSSSS